MKRIYRWDDAPHPVVTRHICRADSTADVPTNIGEIFGGSNGQPPSLEPIIGPVQSGFLGGLGSILQSIAPIVLPILETAIGQPELILPTEAGFAALNAGEGIANQKPFGQIALGLGESAAGAALGGQFGDFGLGDAFGGGTSFFGGGADPLAATGDAAAANAAAQFGPAFTGAGEAGLGGFSDVGALLQSGGTGADLGPTNFGADVTGALGQGAQSGGFNDPLAPFTQVQGAPTGTFAPTGSETGFDASGTAQFGAGGESAPDMPGTTSTWDLAHGVNPDVNMTALPIDQQIAMGFAPDPNAVVGAGAGLAPDVGLPPPIIPDFSAPPVTPDIPTAAPAPAAPAPDLTPIPMDTGVLGTSPVMEVPGTGVPPPPAGVDVAAPGAGTATPGAAAGTGGAATGITPAAAQDPFGLGPTAGGGAPGTGGGDFTGIPTPDSSVNIPQGDTGDSGVGVPGGSPATQLGFDPNNPLGGGANSSTPDPTLDIRDAGGDNTQPPINVAQAAGGGTGATTSDSPDITAAIDAATAAYPYTGGSSPVAQAVAASGVANPADAGIPGSNQAAINAASAGGSAAAPAAAGTGTGISDILKYLGPALGIGGLAKQLLAPGAGVGGGVNTAQLAAQQQALLDELAALRQGVLAPGATSASGAQSGIVSNAASTGANLTGTSSAAVAALMQQANTLATQLLSGNLTPGQQQLVNNNLAATISTIKSRYGSLGQGSSTSEMEDEAAAQAASTGGTAAIGQQNVTQGTNLLNLAESAGTTSASQGIQLQQLAAQTAQAQVQDELTAAGVSGNQTNTLLTQQLAQDAQLSQMIARLAAALNAVPA